LWSPKLSTDKGNNPSKPSNGDKEKGNPPSNPGKNRKKPIMEITKNQNRGILSMKKDQMYTKKLLTMLKNQ
jgi:hypothetical protein